MDRQQIKNILKTQAKQMPQAVADKLAYLKGNEVFAPSYDESLLNAFAFTTTNRSQISTPQRRSVDETDRGLSTTDSKKQNIAAKIAALRGMSSAGGYLRRK